LLTNYLEFGSSTISPIYKDRWQIELFFKALKQNLKVKTFVGTTENALYIQISILLVSIESGCLPSLESVYVPGLMGIDRSSF
jgi:IS4 transposase